MEDFRSRPLSCKSERSLDGYKENRNPNDSLLCRLSIRLGCRSPRQQTDSAKSDPTHPNRETQGGPGLSHQGNRRDTSEHVRPQIIDEFHRQLDHAMDVSEFYLYVRTLVQCLGDSHTRIETPPGFTVPQITESMRQFATRLRQLVTEGRDSRASAPYTPAPRPSEYTRLYSHHFFPEDNTCLVVINTFGMPDQIEEYTKAFRETFKTTRKNRTANPVIDIRENRGGCGLTATELLKYLTPEPFRQIEHIEQRLGPELYELCEEHDLDLDKVMAEEYGIDLEGLRSRGEYRSRMTVVGQEPLKSPHGPADRFKGTVYLLIGKPTFSAASNFAATVKHYGLATLIGQETSGERDHYGSVVWIQLPHSQLKGQVSTAHMVTVGGMEDRGGVKPDYEIRQKPDDTAKGVDTALQFMLCLIKDDRGDPALTRKVSKTSDKGIDSEKVDEQLYIAIGRETPCPCVDGYTKQRSFCRGQIRASSSVC